MIIRSGVAIIVWVRIVSFMKNKGKGGSPARARRRAVISRGLKGAGVGIVWAEEVSAAFRVFNRSISGVRVSRYKRM